ncbi:hypothetical protein AAG906_010111 [Vitis piasezkii]
MEMEMELLMSEVFETVSALKRAVKDREVEVKNLKEKLKSTTSLTNISVIKVKLQHCRHRTYSKGRWIHKNGHDSDQHYYGHHHFRGGISPCEVRSGVLRVSKNIPGLRPRNVLYGWQPLVIRRQRSLLDVVNASIFILFLIPLNGEQRSKTVESETAMATFLLSHLSFPISPSTVDAHDVGSIGGAVKSSFLHCTKLFFTPKLGRSAVRRGFRFPSAKASFDHIPKQFREGNLQYGLMENYKNVPQYFFFNGLTPSQMDMMWSLSGMNEGPSKYSMSVSMYHGRRDVSTLSFDPYR